MTTVKKTVKKSSNKPIKKSTKTQAKELVIEPTVDTKYESVDAWYNSVLWEDYDNCLICGDLFNNRDGVRGCNKCIDRRKMSLVDKITWVLTAVNIAILISLVIKNVWMK